MDSVLVAILVSQQEPWLPQFLDCLSKLDYPQHDIRHAFVEGKKVPLLHKWAKDNTWIKKSNPTISNRFEKLAYLRNLIVDEALPIRKETYVLWIDSDVVDFPPNLIVDLIKHNLPVVAPTVYIDGTKQFYDTLAFRFLDGKNFPAFNPERSQYKKGNIYKYASDELLHRVMLPGRTSPSLMEVSSVGTCYLANSAMYTQKKVRYHGGDSEQVTFCKDVCNVGHKIYVDFTIKVHHAHLKKYGKNWH